MKIRIATSQMAEVKQEQEPCEEYPKVEFRQDATKDRNNQWNHFDAKEFGLHLACGHYIKIPDFYKTFQAICKMPMDVLLSWFEFKYFIGIIPCVEFRLSWYACNLMTGEWSKIDMKQSETSEVNAMYDSLMKECYKSAQKAAKAIVCKRGPNGQCPSCE